MVRDKFRERLEALSAYQRTQYRRLHAVHGRKGAAQTRDFYDVNTTLFSARGARAEREAAAKRVRERVRRAAAARARKPSREAGAGNSQSRVLELHWLNAHRHEYPGLWLALDGDNLAGASESLAEALRQAQQKGSTNPLVAWSEDPREVPFGGW
jgi:hypothetical protein